MTQGFALSWSEQVRLRIERLGVAGWAMLPLGANQLDVLRRVLEHLSPGDFQTVLPGGALQVVMPQAGALDVEARIEEARRQERERCVDAIREDLRKWREYLARWDMRTQETIELCAEQVDFVVTTRILGLPDPRLPHGRGTPMEDKNG